MDLNALDLLVKAADAVKGLDDGSMEFWSLRDDAHAIAGNARRLLDHLLPLLERVLNALRVLLDLPVKGVDVAKGLQN